jgi:putative FmdB family regulatory protein
MPTYSYKCTNCGEKVDETVSIKNHTSTIVCIGCGGTMNQYHDKGPNVSTYFKGSYKDQNPCRQVYRHN